MFIKITEIKYKQVSVSQLIEEGKAPAILNIKQIHSVFENPKGKYTRVKMIYDNKEWVIEESVDDVFDQIELKLSEQMVKE